MSENTTEPFWLRALTGQRTRRDFLRDASAFGTLLFGMPPVSRRARTFAAREYPFTLGIASGDPWPGSVVLWTRLAPRPLEADGGMPAEAVTAEWELAADERFSRVVRRGSVVARPEFAHSVHVEADGLEPDREYWYRFHAGGEASPAGRTRTAPAAGASPAEIRFAFASCQHYEYGYYTALRHMAEEDVHFIVHLGDYIYENGTVAGRARRHDPEEILTLGDYRRRYALYKADADLQIAHAVAPWIVTWDDHEVDNNYAGAFNEKGWPAEAFLRRRAAAYQAYWEHMPLRPSAMPNGPDMPLYRRFDFGRLIELNMLDTRQYRTRQPCGGESGPRCDGALDAAATMMGAAQERWLDRGLARSAARWNVLGNQVPIAEVDNEPGPGTFMSFDRWDGYVAARRRLLGSLAQRRVRNPVVLTGDIHSNWVADLRPDFADPASPLVGAEFIVTSLTSGGDGSDTSEFGARALRANPHMRFFNNQRGYVRCSVRPDRWLSDYRVVDYVSRPGSPIRTRASFVVEDGRPGAAML